MTVRWADRRVRQARLAAADRAQTRRGAILLEDALATASLPGAGEARLVVIRALALGPIHLDRPPAALARSIERAVARLGPGLVHAEHPRAASAPAVWFADRNDARAALAVRLARGPAPRDWFWPLAVPGWRPGLDARSTLRALVLAAGRPPAGPHEVVALLTTLAERDVVDEALAALAPSDGAPLLAALGVAGPPASGETPPAELDAEAGAQPVAARWRPPLERWVPYWGATDARSAWLAAVALVAERPARLLDRALPERVAALVRRAAPARWAVTPPAASPGTLAPDGAVSTEAWLPGPHGRPEAAAPPAALWVALAEGQPSPHAGLVLLIPLLSRLGMGPRLRASPRLIELDLPRRLLAHLADRLRVPPDDPACAALDLPLEPAALPPELRAVVTAWAAGVRGWSRRRLGLPLAALVRRPGRLRATRTHLDATFELRAADIRIRRAALDVDPGWVDWLGRVVAFRYE